MSSYHGQAVQGTGLSFIVYTEAIKNMEVSQLWSVLYFFMLLMLGIGSMLGNTAAILTPLTDSKVISSHLPKEAISGEGAHPWRRSGLREGWAWGLEQMDELCASGGHLPAGLPPSLLLGAIWDLVRVTHPCLWFSIMGKHGGHPSLGEGQTHQYGAQNSSG